MKWTTLWLLKKKKGKYLLIVPGIILSLFFFLF